MKGLRIAIVALALAGLAVAGFALDPKQTTGPQSSFVSVQLEEYIQTSLITSFILGPSGQVALKNLRQTKRQRSWKRR